MTENEATKETAEDVGAGLKPALTEAAEAKTEKTKPAAKKSPKKTAPQVAVYPGTGRRKDASARVRLMPGSGKFLVNGKAELKAYFGRETLCTLVRQPLVATGTETKFDVIAAIQGGGLSGQAGALRHGIARALLQADAEYRAELKKNGYLTRDSRMVERKKYGLKKARKRSQFSKR